MFINACLLLAINEQYIFFQDARHLMLPWVVVTILMVIVDTAALIYECVISVSLGEGGGEGGGGREGMEGREGGRGRGGRGVGGRGGDLENHGWLLLY